MKKDPSASCPRVGTFDERINHTALPDTVSGRAMNSRRHGRAMTRAHRLARLTRALSVAMPVFAYICRYSFEIRTKASRARSVGVQRERAQIRGRL